MSASVIKVDQNVLQSAPGAAAAANWHCLIRVEQNCRCSRPEPDELRTEIYGSRVRSGGPFQDCFGIGAPQGDAGRITFEFDVSRHRGRGKRHMSHVWMPNFGNVQCRYRSGNIIYPEMIAGGMIGFGKNGRY